MQRREFIKSVGAGSAVALGASLGQAGNSNNVASCRANSYADVLAVQPGDAEAYFTEERLLQAIDTTVPLRESNLKLPPITFQVGNGYRVVA